MSYRDDVHELQHKQEEEENIASSIVHTFQQRAGQASLQQASELGAEVKNIAVKNCLLAMTNNR